MRLTGKILALIILLAYLLSSVLFAEEKSSQGENFRLIHSDKLFLANQNKENILELFGNVHFFYGKTEFYSSKATIYDTQKIARLEGSVRVSNDTLVVNADSISYYRLSNLLNMGGNVIITEQKKGGIFNRFTCDEGSYDKGKNLVIANQNVKAFSQSEQTRAKCGYAYWDRQNGYGYMIGNPELWSEGSDTLYVRAEKMEFFDADHKIIATFNVLAQSKDYSATSDFLLYFLKEDKAIFQGQPRFTSDFANAVAGEFYLYFKDRKLFKAELTDSCQVWFAEEKGKAKTNWVKSAFISLNLDNDYLKDFQAENKVTYYFEQQKQEKKDYFSNAAEGDFLSAKFKDDGKLEIMKMRNKVKGIYRFENKP